MVLYIGYLAMKTTNLSLYLSIPDQRLTLVHLFLCAQGIFFVLVELQCLL